MTADKKLYRSLTQRTIAGVAGGLAEHFNIDPVIVRIAFVIAGFCGGGILLYIILWIVIPEQTLITSENTENTEKTNSENINNNTSTNMENQFETKKRKKKLSQ